MKLTRNIFSGWISATGSDSRTREMPLFLWNKWSLSKENSLQTWVRQSGKILNSWFLTGLTAWSPFFYPQNTSDNWFSLRSCFVIWRSSIVQWISPDAWTSSGQIMTIWYDSILYIIHESNPKIKGTSALPSILFGFMSQFGYDSCKDHLHPHILHADTVPVYMYIICICKYYILYI